MMQNTNPVTDDKNPTLSPKICVLVVDDNYASRLVAKVMLERENYDVALAANGKDAVALTSVQVFDLILMDIQMPIMDGIQTARSIRHSSNLNCATTIIALTAYADIAVKEDIKKAGMTDMLTKPLDLGQLSTVWQRAKLNTPSNALPAMESSAANINTLGTEPFDQNLQESVLNINVIGPIVAAASAPTLHRLFNSFYVSTNMSISLISINAQDANAGNVEAKTIIETQAHALKGAAANVGFWGLSLLAAKVQTLPPNLMDTVLPQLKLMLKISQAELHCYLERNYALAV